jgi:peptide chain release factor 2
VYNRCQKIKTIARGIIVVELEQYKYQWGQYSEKMSELRESFNIDIKTEKIKEIEGTMEEPGFWDDIQKSQESMKELKQLKNSLEIITNLQNKYELRDFD